MAYDSQRAVTVLFGGYNETTPLGDTWEWDGTAWTIRSVIGPSPRYLHAMAYDSERGVTVLFGGAVNTNCAETWEWDGTTWRQAATCTGPVPMLAASMAYDSRRGVTVLFGGTLDLLNGSPMGNTWEWNGTTWTERATAGPMPREFAQMAYDSRRGVTVLFGGDDGTHLLGDTWEWDGTAWTARAPAGPPASNQGAMVYDENIGASVLFGGFIIGGLSSTTYAWDGNAWAACPQTGPAARFGYSMVYDSTRLTTVLFGGAYYSANQTLLFDDTWGLQHPTILYVNWANTGFQDGSLAFPFDTILQALTNGGNGTAISIQAGDYPEAPFSFSKRGHITATGGTVTIH